MRTYLIRSHFYTTNDNDILVLCVSQKGVWGMCRLLGNFWRLNKWPFSQPLSTVDLTLPSAKFVNVCRWNWFIWWKPNGDEGHNVTVCAHCIALQVPNAVDIVDNAQTQRTHCITLVCNLRFPKVNLESAFVMCLVKRCGEFTTAVIQNSKMEVWMIFVSD